MGWKRTKTTTLFERGCKKEEAKLSRFSQTGKNTSTVSGVSKRAPQTEQRSKGQIRGTWSLTCAKVILAIARLSTGIYCKTISLELWEVHPHGDLDSIPNTEKLCLEERPMCLALARNSCFVPIVLAKSRRFTQLFTVQWHHSSVTPTPFKNSLDTVHTIYLHTTCRDGNTIFPALI